MSCIKSSNNKFFNSSARMSDGRLFTDYRPNHEVNKHIINNNNITDTHNYRMFLITNAEEIIKRNRNYIYLKNGIYDCKQPYKTGTMLPEQSRVVCDPHKCSRILIDKNGLGEGREYVTNGPNELLDSLKKSEVNENNICSDTQNNLNYYPIDTNMYMKDKSRKAISGGGDKLSGGDPNVLF